MSYTSTMEVLDGWTGTYDDATQGFWLRELIDEAELVVESRIGISLNEWASTSSYRDRALRTVVKRAVRRVMRNPDGLESETDGDYTYRVSARTASGVVTITDEDWALLGVGGQRVGTIRLGSGVRS